jgi:tRNA A-37 threonylcarbamoyl transferase component Bud32
MSPFPEQKEDESGGANGPKTILDYLKLTSPVSDTVPEAEPLIAGDGIDKPVAVASTMPDQQPNGGLMEETRAIEKAEEIETGVSKPEESLLTGVVDTDAGQTASQAIAAGSDDEASRISRMIRILVIVMMIAQVCAVQGSTHDALAYAFYAVAMTIYSCSLYLVLRRLRSAFKISELSPSKASIATLLPLSLFPVIPAVQRMLVAMYVGMVPMKTLIPIVVDSFILEMLTVMYFIYWQVRWPQLVARRLYAVEHFARLSKSPKPRLVSAHIVALAIAGLMTSGSVWLFNIWFFAVLFYFLKRAQAALPQWQKLDVPEQFALSAMVNSLAHPQGEGFVVVRYRAFAGVERWLKDRFSERSWKKGVMMLSLGMAFFCFNGPTILLQMVTGLLQSLSLGGVASGTSAALALSAANQSAIAVITKLITWPFFIFMCLYMSKPTHVQLSRHGVRFLWRHLLLRFDGPLKPWSRIDEITMLRPFGKTLPQDFSLCFKGNGRALLSAKLASMSSVDDKAAVLDAIDKWAQTTERSAEVTDLLRPPADHSYTELWLQALTAPPKRERLKPLMSGVVLHDGQYHVIEQIGSGGQGFAYLATQINSGREVVLKEYILPVFVDLDARRAAVERFEREARTLQSLSSSNIVELLDFFIEDHRAYLVLEHIEGESLKQLVERSGVVSQSDCVKLAEQMCEILIYLHGLTPPLVHRDFTPDNLILRPDGTLKLIDFNVAQQSQTSNFTGTVVGKHSYLPPEQFRGAAVPQSDIYALGGTLFFLLVGHDPEPITVSHPGAERADVKERLDGLVARATALDVSRRYEDVRALKHDLDSLAGEIVKE